MNDGFLEMRTVGAFTSQCLTDIREIIKPGLRTLDIDHFVREFARKNNLICACDGYRGFPGACCTSVNHIICHGITSDKELNEGDIVKIDITFIKNGWYGDSCKTFAVGEKINPKIIKLLEITKESMWKGVDIARPGNTIGDIGRIIQGTAESNGFSVVRDFVGHGIGREFHCPPAIPHYQTSELPDVHRVLTPGLMFTIEPMLNAGKADYKTLGDGWTTVTRDRSWSAQFEVTIGITETGNEVFTPMERDEIQTKV
jgi:methionyl aminopeptidase